jgi:hypothetical protein
MRRVLSGLEALPPTTNYALSSGESDRPYDDEHGLKLPHPFF